MASHEKLKNVAVRDNVFGFVGERVKVEVMKILPAASEDEYPGLWEQMYLLQRIENEYKAIAEDEKRHMVDMD